MKRIVAAVLITLLAAPPAPAAQKQPKPIDWQKLRTGTKIVLTTTEAQAVTERVVYVNESVLVTRKAAPPRLPERVEKALLDAGSWWPDVFNHGATSKSGSVRASLEGVFDGDKKLAELAEVVRYTPRADVLSISEPPHSHAGWWVLIGVVAFFVVIGFMSPNT